VAIITAAEYKTWRSISVTTYDALIAILIAAAQSAAEDWCGRLFDNTSRDQYYSGSGGATLQVNAYPITAITEIGIFDQATQSTIQTLTANEDYFFVADTGLIYRTNATTGRWGVGDDRGWNSLGGGTGDRWGTCPNWPRGNLNIKVEYDGGYTTAPSSLKMAMYLYVDYLWSLSWANAVLPPQSIGAVFKEKIDRYEYELANLDEGNIKVAVSRGLFLSQAKLQELFGIYRRGDLL